MTPEQLKYSILKKAFSGTLVSCTTDEELPKVKAIKYEEPPFDIPNGWFWSNLGNCCNMYTGNSIPESVKKAKYAGLKEGYDYIATKDVTFEHTIEYDNGVRIPFNDDFRIAYSGSVLMCIEGGSAGRKIGILDRDVCFGNKLCSFNSSKIVNKYIYYYLQSHEFKSFFMGNMSGIIGGVSIKRLKELPIPIPTLSEQKAIVAKIEELLPYVDRYAEAYETLEQFNAKFPEDMKKSILQYAIQGKLVEQRPEEGTAEELYQQIQKEKQKLIKEGKIRKEKPLPEITEDEIPFDIPGNWKFCKLGDCIDLLSGQDLPSSRYNEKKEGVVYLTGASNIDGDQIVINRWTTTPTSVAIKGNLLLTCKGTIGKTCILNLSEAHIARQIMAITEINIDKEYLRYFIEISISNLQRKAKSMIPGIDRDKVRGLTFPLPPIKEQHRIVAKIRELLPHCEMVKAYLNV